MNGRNRPSGMDWIRRSTRMAIYHRDGFRCCHCGTTTQLSLHHVDPKGGNRPDNLVTLCMPCNQREESNPCGHCNAWAFLIYLARPLDRAEGLRLAKAKWPERYAQEKKYRATKNANR